MNFTFFTQTADRIQERQRKIRRNARCRSLKQKRRRTAKRTIPAYANCKNCGTELHGMYCHKCGQYALDVKQTFWRYINEFMQNTYQYDGRLISTLRLMFAKPGELSAEFERGRINSYVHPLKLYMFVSVVFFSFVIAFAPSLNAEPEPEKDSQTELKKESAESENYTASEKTERVTYILEDQTASDTTADIARPGQLKLGKQPVSQAELIDQVKDITPLVMICLIPLYAGILRWFYRRSGKRYLQCFVFAIHIQTVMLIIASVWIFLACIKLEHVPWIMEGIMFIYLVLASRRFFGLSWIRTTLKSLFSLFWYVLLSAIIVLAALVLYIATFMN